MLNEGKEIFDGFSNLLKDKLGKLDPETKKLAIARLVICNGCEANVAGVCNPLAEVKDKLTGDMVKGCGCVLSSKCLSPSSSCPANKW